MAQDRRRWLGSRGEALARRHLEARGLEIVDANYRTRWGELDLVAAGGGAVVFCEVKTRSERPGGAGLGPLTSVGPRKRARVRRMAREWLSERADLVPGRPAALRFDAIGITLDRAGDLVALDHVEAAF